MGTAKGRSLELFFINGKPDGMLTAQVPFKWTGHVLMTRRSQIKEALDRKETSRTGIYILLGENDDGPLAYIGETEEIRERIKQHTNKKDWWDTAILITDSDDQLNKAHVKYLESRLIDIARTIGKVKLENGTTPPLPSLTEAAICNMEGFLENVLLVLPALRIDFFLADTRPGIKIEKVVEQRLASPVFVLHTKKHGIHATAVTDGGDFIVQAGSQAKAEWTGMKGHTYMGLHNELVKTGVLVEDGKLRKFSQNYAFKSPSAAAAVSNGRAANGRRAWKVMGTNQTYHEWEIERLDGVE
ncbi:MAG: GIY-YIG nuclease family protein [Aliivibrio sp.]|uniref:GIY-YIG nuclease family protein n=1 Tax=Aliivibrio sp. TaxID=1872443 RepID=UPI001A5AF646|nr:GIY-YIG nuclease family protein [Aliivibrio sp.]